MAQSLEKLTIDEYCTLRSKTDRRLEFLGGFAFHMKHVRKLRKGTQQELDAEFEKYAKLPV